MHGAQLEKPSDRDEIRRAQEQGRWCSGCGVVSDLVTLLPDDNNSYCPDCAALYLNGDLAFQHLAALIADALPKWKAYWVARGVPAPHLRYVIKDVEEALVPSDTRITSAFDAG